MYTKKVSVSEPANDINDRNLITAGEHIVEANLTYAITVDGPKDHLATFPFAGTLEHAVAEAKRVASCLQVDVSLTVRAWFELDDDTV